MTDEELKEYYADLLILQYRGKPRARATIKLIVDPIIMNQVKFAVRDAYDLDTAVGVQLDVLGKYAGISRKALTFTGTVILSDSDYRLAIKMKITQNNSGSSLADIQTLISIFFPTSLRVFDYKNMHMDYLFDSAFGTVTLAEVFVRQGLLPRPMGVELGALIYAPNINNFFGMRTYELPAMNVHGFNTYSVYDFGDPWLSYADAITP